MMIFPLEPGLGESLRALSKQAVIGLDRATHPASDVRWLRLRGGLMHEIRPLTLPEALRQYSGLQVLEIEHYTEVHMTAVLGDLPALHTLILLGNEFSPGGMRLGPHLDQIRELRSLYVDGFFPLSLTDHLSNCTSLRKLWIEDCQVEGLEVIGNITDLEELSIDQIPSNDLARLSRLTRLRLFSACAPPECILKLPLQTLALPAYSLAVLPTWLGQMDSLQELDLCGSSVKELPKGFPSLRRLEVIGTPLMGKINELQARFRDVEIIS